MKLNLQLRFYALTLCSLAVTAALFAADDKPTPKVDAAAIKQLIDELGADEFSARESATEQLARIGLPAYKAVEDAVAHPDREVRYRAERVLGRIRQSDLQRRLDAFLRGGEETDDYQLPGWTRFKKAYGDHSDSRAVFVDLTKADGELLQTLESNPKGVADVVTNRVTQYQQLMQNFGGGTSMQLSFGQIGALVFVTGEEDVVQNQNHSNIILSFCNQQALSEAVTNGSRREIPRQMLARIIVRSEDWAAYSAMNLARRFNMKEGLIPAEKILKGNRQPHMASMALTTIAIMGDEKHLPMVEKLLTDTSPITQMQEKDKVITKLEVRDAALATALFLTKQDLKTYFTPRDGQTIGEPSQVMTNVRVIGFSDEAKRAEVFKKWADYRAKHPAPVENVKEDAAKPAESKEAKPVEPTKPPEKK